MSEKNVSKPQLIYTPKHHIPIGEVVVDQGVFALKLKKHGALLVNFVIDFANGDMSREDFDMDYSGYVIEHFPEFEREHPRLSRRFVDTIERTYSTCSWMTDEAFQYAIGNAVDEFLGNASVADIY